MEYLALFLLLLSGLLFWQSSRLRRSAGLPGGRIVYTDTRAWGKLEKPLYDPLLALTGKPDYLVQQADMIIPVEVKSGKAPATPYASHVFQLAAYCLLVERAFQKRPPHGILHYSDRDLEVNYTRELEADLLDLLSRMKQARRQKQVQRSHSEARRCQKCGFQSACDQKL